MTTLARWLTIVSIATLALGLVRGNYLVALMGLSLLLWILNEWIWFTIYSQRELSSLKVERRINGDTESRGILWAQRPVSMELTLTCRPHLFIATRTVRDIVPELLELSSSDIVQVPIETTGAKLDFIRRWQNRIQIWITKSLESLDSDIRWARSHDSRAVAAPLGSNQVELSSRQKTILMRYELRPRCAGEVRMPGVRLHLQDRYGLFRKDVVIRKENRFRVLPPYVAGGETNPTTKRINAIPQHGIHRQPRPGLGFELLELREYVDGDPPKSIAWKATARRDVLMTRQYESEIPVRVQLLIDGTSTARIGGYGLRMIDQYAVVAASVARLATSGGDLVGAYVVDDNGVERVQARPGDKGFYDVLQAISKHSVNHKGKSTKLLGTMLDWSYALCSERYPELLEPNINPPMYADLSFFVSRWGRMRNQLSAILAERYDLSVKQHVELLFDDVAMAEQLQQFLCDEGMPWMAPVLSAYEIESMYADSDNRPLVDALNKAIMQAKDNEVMVLFADLIRKRNGFDELCSALKLARAKHHRVAVVCASPNFARPSHVEWNNAKTASEIRQVAEQTRVFERSREIKSQMLEIGVSFSMSGETKAVPLVLSEITLARSGRHISSTAGRR